MNILFFWIAMSTLILAGDFYLIDNSGNIRD